VITESTITCPACGTSKTETMPTDACQYFYECSGCGRLLRPKTGDCCVFCSYGSVPCPPVQTSAGERLCCQSSESRMTAEIRPGIHRPDWSVVTKPAAREALIGRDRVRAGPAEKWIGTLPMQADLAWRTALELFGRLGRPPYLAEIGQEIGLLPEQIQMLVSELQTHDLLGTDGTDAIVYAYPFTKWATEHRVELHGRKLNALCAIDCSRRWRDVSCRRDYRVLLPSLWKQHRNRHRANRARVELCTTDRCGRVVRSGLQRCRRHIVLPVDRLRLLR
jgi:hypothetical protein